MTTTGIKKSAHETEASISDMLQEAKDAVIDFKDESLKPISNQIEKQINELGELMKTHPLLAIGIGVGAGYLLARIVHR